MAGAVLPRPANMVRGLYRDRHRIRRLEVNRPPEKPGATAPEFNFAKTVVPDVTYQAQLGDYWVFATQPNVIQLPVSTGSYKVGKINFHAAAYASFTGANSFGNEIQVTPESGDVIWGFGNGNAAVGSQRVPLCWAGGSLELVTDGNGNWYITAGEPDTGYISMPWPYILSDGSASDWDGPGSVTWNSNYNDGITYRRRGSICRLTGSLSLPDPSLVSDPGADPAFNMPVGFRPSDNLGPGYAIASSDILGEAGDLALATDWGTHGGSLANNPLPSYMQIVSNTGDVYVTLNNGSSEIGPSLEVSFAVEYPVGGG